jgi:hypothetical protein
MLLRLKQPCVLPGFGLTLGYTVLYLSLVVLIPLSALFVKTSGMTWHHFCHTVTDPRVVASYRLTFTAALAGATINAVFGFVVAWTLVRYSFPGKRIVDALVDLPFALPTAVSGIAQLFVRPYDLDLHLEPNGKPSLPARVARVQSAGPLVRLELLGAAQQTIRVEMSHDRYRQPPVAVGRQVFVTPREPRVFADDYSI